MDDTLAARVAALDLTSVQSRFENDLPPGAPYHHREATGLEYRRLLLLALSRPDLDVAPGRGPVERYWWLHAERPRFSDDCARLTDGTGIEPQRLVPPHETDRRAPADRIRAVYLARFPAGDADLWGWPVHPEPPRISAPELGVIGTRLPDAVDDRTHDALRSEALSLRAGASGGHSPTGTVERGCVTGGAGGFHHADAGPALHAWHWGGELARRITDVTGTVVVPTGVFYNYHRDGDSSPLHNDPFATELVVLTLLDGPAERLYLHPELAGTSLAEIGALSARTRGHPDGGIAYTICRDPFLMSGQTVPHHRPPARRTAEVVVAAQFFGVLDPRRRHR